jgi:hypothetical protein
LRKQLEERGIAVDPVEEPLLESLPISIGLDPNPMSNMIFPIWNGLATAVCIWVELVTSSARYIDDVCLWLPFGDLAFEWCADPQESTGRMYYEFPGGDSFPRGDVVNHRLKRALQPGKPLKGFLLGISYQPLPSNLRFPVVAKLAIFDALDEMLAQKAVQLYLPSPMEKATVPSGATEVPFCRRGSNPTSGPRKEVRTASQRRYTWHG